MTRTPAQRYEDLIVWQKAHALVLNIYKSSRAYPREETYGLTSQVRRASVSVAGNIAGGFKRRGRADKAQILNIADASLDEETRYYLRLAEDLGYGSSVELREDAAEVGRLLGAYTQKVLSSAS